MSHQADPQKYYTEFSDEDAFLTVKKLYLNEVLFGGSSSGAVMSATHQFISKLSKGLEMMTLRTTEANLKGCIHR